MSILIDPRAGSGPRTVTRTSPFTGEKHTRRYLGLNEFPPLNLCVECGKACSERGEGKCVCPSPSPFSCLSSLEAGDVAFTGNGPHGDITVGVEVKSLSDLLASIEDGRLRARQIPDMIAAFDVRWLLYYGTYRCCPATGNLQVPRHTRPAENGSSSIWWEDYKFGNRSSKRVVPYAYLESFLASPSLTNTRIHVKHCYDLAECARWIGVLHHIWQKPYSSHSSMMAFDTSADLGLMPLLSPSLKQRARTIATFPGVSYQRAVAIARAFPSLRALFNCTEDKLAEVQIPAKDGKGKARRLGKVLAKSIVGLITREG